MRIPKRVNAAWDWADSHPRVSVAGILLPILAVGALWVPLLAAFVVGLVGGGLVVHHWLSRRITRLRREVDELLRENGKLLHRNTILASGVVESGALVTQQILAIPEAQDEDEDEPAAAKTAELTQVGEEDLIEHRKSA